jgi:hypothetical protein
MGVMKRRSDGAAPNADSFGDLLLGEIAEVAEENDKPFLLWENSERSAQFRPLPLMPVARLRRELCIDRPETPPLLLATDIDERPPQPALQAALAPKRPASAQRNGERLLNGVACTLSIAKQRVAEPQKRCVAAPVDLLDRSLGRTRSWTHTENDAPDGENVYSAYIGPRR